MHREIGNSLEAFLDDRVRDVAVETSQRAEADMPVAMKGTVSASGFSQERSGAKRLAVLPALRCSGHLSRRLFGLADCFVLRGRVLPPSSRGQRLQSDRERIAISERRQTTASDELGSLQLP